MQTATWAEIIVPPITTLHIILNTIVSRGQSKSLIQSVSFIKLADMLGVYTQSMLLQL